MVFVAADFDRPVFRTAVLFDYPWVSVKPFVARSCSASALFSTVNPMRFILPRRSGRRRESVSTFNLWARPSDSRRVCKEELARWPSVALQNESIFDTRCAKQRCGLFQENRLKRFTFIQNKCERRQSLSVLRFSERN